MFSEAEINVTIDGRTADDVEKVEYDAVEGCFYITFVCGKVVKTHF